MSIPHPTPWDLSEYSDEPQKFFQHGGNQRGQSEEEESGIDRGRKKEESLRRGRGREGGREQQRREGAGRAGAARRDETPHSTRALDDAHKLSPRSASQAEL